jgi:hypothetical protein
MTFQKGIARTETLTVRQCEDVIAVANGMLIFATSSEDEKINMGSIALAQALQFELCLRHQSGKRSGRQPHSRAFLGKRRWQALRWRRSTGT